MFDMKRREFILLLGGATAWPLAARAQQPERMRRIGILLPAAGGGSSVPDLARAFLQGLALLGWTIGRNVRVETRWSARQGRRHSQIRGGTGRACARCHSGPMAASTVGPLLQATRTVPIVFLPVIGDPVGAGFVDNLARPGGNATGFMVLEFSLTGKWLELLKEIAPSVRRVAVLRDSAIQGSGTSQFAAIQTLRRRSGWRSTRSTCATLARSIAPIAAFARSPERRPDYDHGRRRRTFIAI